MHERRPAREMLQESKRPLEEDTATQIRVEDTQDVGLASAQPHSQPPPPHVDFKLVRLGTGPVPGGER
ncbi:hypothetical protein IAQ61_001785 [Plenodomus lingam]|uniref:uncharacterized protein n=1 Tax=Leptosphaeria maculans TaxID=5022 RepID=UPI00332F58B4|nr:hypothetical protein IAQ61_001785 [Plenodomus lingam]